jgi:cation diffusion facilitator family transporter
MSDPPQGPPLATVQSTRAQVERAVSEGTRAAVVGVVVSSTLAAVKISAGLVGNSYALVADGVESVLDLLASVLVLAGLRANVRPQSGRYPYGLGKAESLAAVAVATMLLVAAIGIAGQAIREILTPQARPAPFTLIVLSAVVVVKELLYRFLIRKGQDIDSRLLTTDAWHHRSDALTSIAAFLGISIALFAGDGYESADDWAALAACVIIAYNGIRLFRASLREVLDVAASPAIVDRVRALAARVEGVGGIDEVRVRRSGLVYLVDIHVEVDPELSVRAGHGIGHAVKDVLITSELPILDVLVHVEPERPGNVPPLSDGRSGPWTSTD